MDQVPDIRQGVQPVENPAPSGGPFSKQRQANQAFRHNVAKDKIKGANGPKQPVPGSGQPGKTSGIANSRNDIHTALKHQQWEDVAPAQADSAGSGEEEEE